MTEVEYLTLLAEKSGAPIVQVRSILMCMKNLNIELLPKGEVIPIPGLGQLLMAMRKGRKGINPSTGQPMLIKDKQYVKFKPTKALRDAVIL